MSLFKDMMALGAEPLASIHGVAVNTDTAESFNAIIREREAFPDPEDLPKAKKMVISIVSARATDVSNPRSIGTLTEQATGRWHKVLTYDENAGDETWVQWTCESRRV